MIFSQYYEPPSSAIWQGRADSPAFSTFFQRINTLDLTTSFSITTQEPNFGLIGFCSDEGIRRNLGRLGAAQGPMAIRQVLAKLPVHRQSIHLYDCGNICCIDNHLESAQAALGEVVALMLNRGITPIVLGGGHELAWGHYQGIAAQHPSELLGIVNFDAHFDMRSLLPEQQRTSGTPFLQIANAHQAAKRRFDYHCIGVQTMGNTAALFATAREHGAQYLLAEELHMADTQKITQALQRTLDYNQLLYVSLCLDVFAQAYAPGVSAPQSLGITPWQLIPLLRQLAQSGKVVSYDIAELSPPFDLDARTAKLAASLVYEIIHHHQT